MKEKHAELLLLLVGIMWGLGYISVDLLLAGGMGPFTLIGSRFLIAVILLTAIYYKRLLLKQKELVKLFIIGGVLFFAFAMQTIAMNYTTTTNVSFITGINIIFVPFLATFLSKKKLETRNIVAAIIGVVGLSFLTGGLTKFQSGDILAIFGALLFALHIGLIGKLAQEIDIIKLAVWQMLICSILSFAFAFVLNEQVIFSIAHVNIKVMLFTAIVPSALCFLGQNIGIKYTSEAKGSLILATESLWGALFAIILLHEPFSINMIYGAVLMLVAIFIDEINIKKEI